MKPEIIAHWSQDTLCQEQEEKIFNQTFTHKGFSRRNFLKVVGGLSGLVLGSGLWVPRDARAGSVIKQRTISSVTENAVQMSNSRWGRSVTFPTGWTSVRFGIRFHMTDSTANLVTPNFTLGFANGLTALPGDTTPHHFAGFRVQNSANWSRTSTYYQIGSNLGLATFGASVNVAGTWSNTSFLDGSGNQVMYFGNGAAAATADRSLCFITITQGSLVSGTNYNYDFKAFCGSSTTITDVPLSSTFLSKMQDSSPSLTGHSIWPQSGTTTKAIDQTVNGTFDSVAVWWDKTDALMEICDIAFAKLA